MASRSEVKRVFLVYRFTDSLKEIAKLIKKDLEGIRRKDVRWQVQDSADALAPSSVQLLGVIEAVKNADYVAVFVDQMSMNVAFEAGIAFALERPTVVCVPEGEALSFSEHVSDMSGLIVKTYDRNKFTEIPRILEAALFGLHEAAAGEAKKPPPRDYLLAWADSLRLNGLHREAIEKYKACLDREPHSVRALVGLGQAYLAIYDLVRSEKALRKALEANRDSVPAHEVLGQVFLDAGRYGEAVEVYQKLLAKNKSKTEYYFKLAVAFCEMQQPIKGAEALEEAVKEHPEVPSVHYDLAWCAARVASAMRTKEAARWRGRAIEALNRAIGLDEAYRERAHQDTDFEGMRSLKGFPAKP